jgi:hypothetical protein
MSVALAQKFRFKMSVAFQFPMQHFPNIPFNYYFIHCFQENKRKSKVNLVKVLLLLT